jgi:phage gp36-like protein
MSYASADALRDRYLRNGQDEFALRADEDLDQGLQAATAEIDSYLPSGPHALAALPILADKCLTLARMLVHQDDALDVSHPIVRDGLAVRAWLVLVARGVVLLPVDPPAAASATLAAGTRTPVYGADFVAGYSL